MRCRFGVERSLTVRWDQSFMVDLLSCSSFQPMLHNWCNKGNGMYYPFYGKGSLGTGSNRFSIRELLYAPSHRQDGTTVVEHWLEWEIDRLGSLRGNT